MAAKPPAAFLLVSQAALCAPNLVDYPQIDAEMKAGRMGFDPLLHHEGVWLLDHAIEARLKSDAGAREQKKNRGADPCMDALWAQWLSAAAEDVLGGVQLQAARAARLARLGCSLSLDVALSKVKISPRLIQQEDDATVASPLRMNLLARAVKNDHIGTIEILLRHGFAKQSFTLNEHPLAVVKSPDVAQLLLDSGLDPLAVPIKSGSLIDFTSRRSLGAGVMQEIIEVLRGSRKVEDTPEQRLSRVAFGLDKKPLEQLRAQMRDAQWSPSRRGNLPSPVVKWARQTIMNPTRPGVSMAGASLAWLSKQPGTGTVFADQPWSDAAWLWATAMGNDPSECDRFSSAAQDLCRLDPSCRFDTLQKIIDAEQLPQSFMEQSICASLQRTGYIVHPQVKNKELSGLLDILFRKTDRGSWVLSRYHHKQPRSNGLVSIGEYLQVVPGPAVNVSRWMSLALVVASIDEDRVLAECVKAAWNRGIRPLKEPFDAQVVANKNFEFDDELLAMVDAWVLSQGAPAAKNAARSPRF